MACTTAATPLAHPWQLPPHPGNEVGAHEARLAGLTTHLSLWPAANALARWLERNAVVLGLPRPGLKVLELGSGTGWLGAVLAANLPSAASILLTERQEAFERLAAQCVQLSEGAVGPTIDAEVLDWRAFMEGQSPGGAQLPRGGDFDVVLGSDLVWNAETASSLPCMMLALLLGAQERGRPEPLVMYGHWKRSHKPLRAFLENCERVGLAVVPFDFDLRAATQGAKPGPDAPQEPAAAVQAGDPLDDDDEPDWASVIFNDPAPHEDPIFEVYRIVLQS